MVIDYSQKNGSKTYISSHKLLIGEFIEDEYDRELDNEFHVLVKSSLLEFYKRFCVYKKDKPITDLSSVNRQLLAKKIGIDKSILYKLTEPSHYRPQLVNGVALCIILNFSHENELVFFKLCNYCCPKNNKLKKIEYKKYLFLLDSSRNYVQYLYDSEEKYSYAHIKNFMRKINQKCKIMDLPLLFIIDDSFD